MIKKTLYFGNPTYLSLRDRQLVIKLPEVEKNPDLPPSFKQNSEVTKPIEDIGIIILDNRQITLTQPLLSALLDADCALITCDDRSLPVGLMLPLYGNTLQSERFRDQIYASTPLKKQLWQQTIVTKIHNQAAVLRTQVGGHQRCMDVWAGEVKSGDADNREARAAEYYWKSLFGHIDNFVRDREGPPPNNVLNYGYAILRAVVARGLVSSGMLPTLGIHHHNRYNAYCLADDIMEPYRPYVDAHVCRAIAKLGMPEQITKEWKVELLSIPTLDVKIGGKKRPLMIAVTETTASLYRCFSGESRKISYPEM